MKTKQCRKCKEVLSLDSFHKAKGNKDGLCWSCKACIKQYYQVNITKITRRANLYHKRNRDSILKRQRLYRKANKDIIDKKRELHYKNNKEAIMESRKEYYEKNKEKIAARSKEYKINNIEKRKAKMKARTAIQSGKLTRPSICSSCGTGCKPDGHHPDYSKPLEVVWLCRSCHNKVHIKLKKLPKHQKKGRYEAPKG